MFWNSDSKPRPPLVAAGHVLIAAVAWSAVFIALRYALEPVLLGQAPLLALLAAPILASLSGGVQAGFLATVICAIGGDLLFIAPHGSLIVPSASEWVRLAIFTCYGLLFSWIVSSRASALQTLRRQHADLVRAELRARRALESAPSGMLVVNREGGIELVNKEAERLFGYSREELLRIKVEELVPESVRARHQGDRARYIEEGKARRMGLPGSTLVARRQDGSVFPVEIGLNPLEEGGPGLVLASVLDITERHRAEEALKDANRRKDEYMAVLAHELRNPLAPIRNAVELLKRLGPDEPRLQRSRAVIERQVAHMARLIDDLLDVSRIARGKLTVQRVRCDLASVARQVVEDYRAGIEKAGLKLSLKDGVPPLWVDGDPVRLAQMIGNLLTNAERFNRPDGTIDVELGFESGKAHVRVRDTGVGIDPELLPRLFTAFEQAQQDIARVQGGLGLGLALTRGLAELHDGTLDGHSDGLGSGATFTLRVPLAAAPQETAAAAVRGDAGASLSLVIIEDNVDSAETLGELLRLRGHSVEIRHTGEEGVEAALRSGPDAVISDIGLPGVLDGYAVARSIRNAPMRTQPLLIALSGYVDEESRRRSAQSGFDAHLGKPADPAALEELLAARGRP
jgi:PAS domain S-box-containing protein